MTGKSDNQDLNHELILLSNNIDCCYFDDAFTPLYAHKGQPSMPIHRLGFTKGFMETITSRKKNIQTPRN